jgi:uncharacterized membrane protein YpjA
MRFVFFLLETIVVVTIAMFCLRRFCRPSRWAFGFYVTCVPLALIFVLTALFAALHKWASDTLETLFELCAVKIG